jgi:peroxiredoxin family protein
MAPVYVLIAGKETIMTEVEVFAGICGLRTIIRVEDLSKYRATCTMESGCPNHKKVAKILDTVTLNAMDELFRKGKSQVIQACQGIVPHASCPVPAAILKTLEVGVGLALPADATITFIKTDKKR